MLNNKGQSLLEVIVALAIFALISATMVTLSIGGFVTLDVGGQQTEAQALAQEGVEAVRAIRDRAWNELTFTTSTVSTSSGQWVFDGEGTVSQNDNYTRTVSILPVCRDINNNITNCPGAFTDVQSKKVISEVDWSVRNTTNTVQQITYLTNWDTNFWTQTDWSGGSGQNIWVEAIKYFSDDNINTSSTGQLQLKYTTDGGCGQMIWDFNNQYQYSYDPTKVEVVGDLGQLKDLGSCSGTTSTCFTLTSSSSCQMLAECIWTPSYAGTNPNIRNINSYSPNQISAWSGFSEIATKNGGEIYYQLSNDDGITWKYWSGTAWATSTLTTDYNISSIINANIGILPTSSKKMMFKAFLSSNGTQQIKLDQVQIDCSINNDSDFSLPVNYLYNTSTIVVSSSLAQLANVSIGSCKGIPKACNTFGTSFNCLGQSGCIWGGSISGSSPVWSNNWGTYLDWQDGARASGSSPTTGGNPTNYKAISLSRINTASTASGYWRRSFVTTVSNPDTATLNFDWSIKNYNATFLTSYKIYVFVDNFSGAPIIGTEVWSATVTGTTGWARVSSLNVASKLTTAGTYYIKLVARRTKTAGNPPNVNNTVGWDNVSLNWSKSNSCSGVPKACNIFDTSAKCYAQNGCYWDNSNVLYATTSPSINPTASLTVPTTTFDKWTRFIETANKNGGEIYYQLSNDDGATWKYWNGIAWTISTLANHYNTSTIINDNISTFSTSTGRLMFKAFLKSNGAQLVQLDNVQVWWQEITGVSGYATLGSVISSAFNLFNSSPVTLISWSQNTSTCGNCVVKFQVRTAPNNAGTPGTWSAWYGPNGAGDYFTDYHGAMIPKILNWNQWVQYQVWFLGDGSSTPILNDVTVYYK